MNNQKEHRIARAEVRQCITNSRRRARLESLKHVIGCQECQSRIIEAVVKNPDTIYSVNTLDLIRNKIINR